MDTHQVEPVGLLLRRLEELYVPIPKCPKETFVPHVAHTIQGELSTPLLQKHWLDLDIVGLVRAPVIVDEATNLK